MCHGTDTRDHHIFSHHRCFQRKWKSRTANQRFTLFSLSICWDECPYFPQWCSVMSSACPSNKFLILLNPAAKESDYLTVYPPVAEVVLYLGLKFTLLPGWNVSCLSERSEPDVNVQETTPSAILLFNREQPQSSLFLMSGRGRTRN